ncbi:MAG TPA: transketolase C-terminal domain-containing protein [Candidatus Limnocylindrales bacterium]|nr:transketolase C-terminal domain-containing protein [Candidatus Limnocylindrales bacterium]
MTVETVARPHVQNFIDWAADKPEVVVLSADLTNSSEVGKWRDTYPDRFFSMGMAEQNMLSFAAGLAREGYTPFIHTFAVFIYRRAYDQLAMSVAYPNLRVRMIGFLPGILTPGGVTHQALEDVAILRATPNMTVLETGDATEVESVLDVAQAVNGPVYVRMLRGAIPRLFPRDEPMVLDRVRILADGTDVALLTAGVETEEGLKAVRALQRRGVGIQHLHVSTHKPFDDPAILGALERARAGIVTAENHTVVGGLGTAIAERLAEHGLGRRLVKVGLQDTYAHGASREHLMREYGLDAAGIVAAVERATGERFGITAAELAAETLDVASQVAAAATNADSL